MARGRKTGGRKKGTRNRRTIAQQEVIASGTTPLEFLCAVYRDPKQSMTRRIEAAKAAAPYLHARFSPTIYTPPQDLLEQDNTINLVFVTPSVESSLTEADRSFSPHSDCINRRTLRLHAELTGLGLRWYALSARWVA
jgi:hypothetical protein